MTPSRRLLSPITILMLVVLVAAAATWLVPAGRYDTLSGDGSHFMIQFDDSSRSIPFTQASLNQLGIRIPLKKFAQGDIRKPVSIPGSFHRIHRNGQGVVDILEAPVKGIMDSIDIILFVLVIGGFMNVFHQTGALVKGLSFLSYRMKGREDWLIILLLFLFSFGGSSYGMAEEALVFYPVMIPLFLAAGYDLVVPVAVIFGGTQLGTLSSFSNPFSTIIASNAAGVNWSNGLTERLLVFGVSTVVMIAYVVRYARRVKKDPSRSVVYRYDGITASGERVVPAATPLSPRTRWLLLLFAATFLVMIAGVVWMDWWLTEMSALFLAASLLIAVIERMSEKTFLDGFIAGAQGLLPVSFIIGVARGVTLVLNEGHISDSIIYFSSRLVSGMPGAAFILCLLGLYMVFTLFISSSSGMAVLTMPIMGGLAILVNLPGREIVNAYLYGMGIMGFLTPTGLILPSLALAGVSYKAWIKFVTPLLLLLLAVCALFLVAGIRTA